MTLDELLVLVIVREVHALERLQASILAQSAPSFEWRCGLIAIDDRLDWLRDSLSREDPDLLAAVDELYRQELQATALKTEHMCSISSPDLRPGARVH